MQVLKFGGTSVATPKNIELVRKILDEKTSNSPVIVVVSAFGGITTLLLECGKQAASGDENYARPLAEITQRHIQMVKSLIGLKNQGKTLSKIRILLNELEDIYRGIYLIRELSPKTIDRILSFGEIASSTIINDAFQDRGYSCRLANSQELIKTNNQYTRAQLKKDDTYKRIRKYFRESEATVTFAAGFIGSDDEGNTTTRGRGGSDLQLRFLQLHLKLNSWKYGPM